MQCMFLVWGSPEKNRRLRGFILTVWLSFCIQVTAGQVSISPAVQDAPVGGTATLSVRTTATVGAFNWYRGTVISDPNRIFTYRPGPPFNHTSGPQHTGREKALPNGDLEIKSLLTTDTGNYTVQIVLQSDFTAQQATAQLRVYEPVTKPTVQYSSSQLVENQGPAVITCDTSSAAETILWYFNDKPFLPDNTRVTLTDKNRTLTIASVSRSESGIYQCQAINPVSSATSDPRTLTVAYGPQNVKIDPPGDQTLQAGTKLTLTCTVASFPDPTYQWFLNNKDLNQPTRTLTVQSLSSRDKGNYTCVAHNTLTGLSPNVTVYIAVNGTDPSDSHASNSPASDWAIAVGVSLGILLVAALIATGVVLFYKRSKRTQKGENTYDNPEMIQDPDPQYENVRKGSPGQSLNLATDADSAYMGLTHRDLATYEQLKRSKT